MALTKGQELALIEQNLCQWQAKHVKPGTDRDLQVDAILSLIDDLAQDIVMTDNI
jgi:hypothetical protein